MTRRSIAILLLVLATQVQAQQYRWINEKGRVQYTDTPPPPGAKGVQKKNFDVGKSEGPAEPYALQVARKAAPVKLYTAPGCADCDAARTYLNQRGIPFDEVSVVYDAELKELTAISGRASVPVMLLTGKMQRGYDSVTYESVLDAAGYPKKGTLPVRNQVAPVAVKPGAKPPAKPAAETPAVPAAK